MSFLVDPSAFPLVRITLEGTIDDDAFRRYLDECTLLLNRGLPYAIVMDASRAGSAGSPQRRMQADFMREHHDRMRTFCMGCAFVIDSMVVRGMMTAVLWLQPMPCPHVVVSRVVEAESWCRSRLPAPPGARRVDPRGA